MARTTDPLSRLKELIAKEGTHERAAQALGVTKGHVADMLYGRRNFSDAILAKLGLERVTKIVSRAS